MSTTADDDVDAAIEAYRAELVAEAELAGADLAEIEDHLRSLVDDLRRAGLSSERAVTEAVRRLGEPRLVAREHARVRSAFGAKLSRARAWSATALLAPFLVYYGIQPDRTMLGHLETLLSAVVIAGLCARLWWARAIVLGTLPVPLALFGLSWWTGSDPGTVLTAQMIGYLGAGAFLMPWHRSELSASGAALMLISVAYGAAMTLTWLQVTTPGGHLRILAPGMMALAAVLLAAAGTILRARWAAVAAGFAAVTLLQQLMTLAPLRPHHQALDVWSTLALGTIGAGAAAAAIAAVLCWRAARSTIGTWRGVLG